MRLFRMAIVGAAVAALGAAPGGPVFAAEVNVYWDRGSYWAGPAFEDFTKRTGIAVTFLVKGEKGEAFDRLEAEGAATSADLVVTNSLARMAGAAKKGLLAQLESKALAANVPAARRDAELRWYGIAGRARTIMYSRGRELRVPRQPEGQAPRHPGEVGALQG